MILHFVKIMGCPEIFHEKTPKQRLIIRSCFGGKCQNMIQNYGGLIGPKMSKIRNSRKLRYEKIMNFSNTSLFFLVFFEVYS